MGGRHTLLLAARLVVASMGLAAAAPALGPEATQSAFLPGAPGSQGSVMAAYSNPALLEYASEPEVATAWNQGDAADLANRWGAFAGRHRLGLGTVRAGDATGGGYESRLSTSVGGRGLSFGLGYGWSSGPRVATTPRRHLLWGLLWRPDAVTSAGITVATASLPNPLDRVWDLAGDIALRPLGTPRLTLFADGSWNGEIFGNRADRHVAWSAGACVNWPRGLHLAVRYADHERVSVGLAGTLGRTEVGTQFHRAGGHGEARRTWTASWGPRRPQLQPVGPARPARYLAIDLRGSLRHRPGGWFDRGNSLSGFLATVRMVVRDPELTGVVVDLTGTRLDPVMGWEVRALLQQVRDAGKKVVVYVDRVDLHAYYTASAASTVVLDPLGALDLSGVVSGRTYFRSLLNRVGVGFDEWRLFDYKSAMEPFSRGTMSDADRRQEQTLVDDEYAMMRDGICLARSIRTDQFEALANDTTVLLPADAVAAGLVDRLGRWDQVDELLRELSGPDAERVDAGEQRPTVTDTWGAAPRVAIVYALGVCDMEEGMEAGRIADELTAARDDRSIRAVVLRVDSPGGDALAADVVAEAVRSCRTEKPVIVSQAQVAASGGYWVSMYADSIVAAPNTITGSIGVIGGWVYDQGVKERLGLSTDHVQAGAHADLGFGLRLFGLQLPDRNLTGAERARVDSTMLGLYRMFVAKVATGRGRTPAAIDSLAQGRVWSGRRARECGLVDRLGGLDTAIDMAAAAAGLAAGQPVELVERPARDWRDVGLTRGPAWPLSQTPEQSLRYLQFRLQRNGLPLVLLPDANPSLQPATAR